MNATRNICSNTPNNSLTRLSLFVLIQNLLLILLIEITRLDLMKTWHHIEKDLEHCLALPL